MRRSIMIALIALLALALAAPLAFAQSQGGKPEPEDNTPFVITGSGSEDPTGAQCTFDVLVEPNATTKEIDVPDLPGAKRTIVIFPASSYTLTNVATGKQVTLNTTGAQHITTEPDGDVVYVVTGLNLLGDPGAGFVLAKGKFSFTLAANGAVTEQLAGKGELIDVCELLS